MGCYSDEQGQGFKRPRKAVAGEGTLRVAKSVLASGNHATTAEIKPSVSFVSVTSTFMHSGQMVEELEPESDAGRIISNHEQRISRQADREQRTNSSLNRHESDKRRDVSRSSDGIISRSRWNTHHIHYEICAHSQSHFPDSMWTRQHRPCR